jgi:hypothetical protein
MRWTPSEDVARPLDGVRSVGVVRRRHPRVPVIAILEGWTIECGI